MLKFQRPAQITYLYIRYLRINYDTLRLYEDGQLPEINDIVKDKKLSDILDFDSLMDFS